MMTSERAKEILRLYRPGTPEDDAAEVAAAMERARQDPELTGWFEQDQAFHQALRTRFREIKVPEHFKAALLACGPRPAPWWRSPLWLAAAAVIVAMLALTGLWFRPSVPDRFSDYQRMMVSKAVRVAYAMDWHTNDMTALRHALARRGAPANYEVPAPLTKLQLTGGAALTWRSHPVSMVCFDRGDKQMLFLFVLRRSALKDPPAAPPQKRQIDSLLTLSWTRGDNVYLLAGPDEPGFEQKYKGAL